MHRPLTIYQLLPNIDVQVRSHLWIPCSYIKVPPCYLYLEISNRYLKANFWSYSPKSTLLVACLISVNNNSIFLVAQNLTFIFRSLSYSMFNLSSIPGESTFKMYVDQIIPHYLRFFHLVQATVISALNYCNNLILFLLLEPSRELKTQQLELLTPC
jgi:hypothetical protein